MSSRKYTGRECIPFVKKNTDQIISLQKKEKKKRTPTRQFLCKKKEKKKEHRPDHFFAKKRTPTRQFLCKKKKKKKKTDQICSTTSPPSLWSSHLFKHSHFAQFSNIFVLLNFQTFSCCSIFKHFHVTQFSNILNFP